MAYSEHICTASFEGVAFLQSHTVSTQRELRKGRQQKVIAPFFVLFLGGCITQVIRGDNERCISVNMEAAPRTNNGRDAGRFVFSWFLIGIEWNVRCLVNVVLNSFKEEKGKNFLKKDRATCCWIASEVNFVQFVVSTSCLGMFRSSWGYRCLLLLLVHFHTFLTMPMQTLYYY